MALLKKEKMKRFQKIPNRSIVSTELLDNYEILARRLLALVLDIGKMQERHFSSLTFFNRETLDKSVVET